MAEVAHAVDALIIGAWFDHIAICTAGVEAPN